jgi:hypothetical protein
MATMTPTMRKMACALYSAHRYLATWSEPGAGQSRAAVAAHDEVMEAMRAYERFADRCTLAKVKARNQKLKARKVKP